VKLDPELSEVELNGPESNADTRERRLQNNVEFAVAAQLNELEMADLRQELRNTPDKKRQTRAVVDESGELHCCLCVLR
jgi:hypothetical protein